METVTRGMLRDWFDGGRARGAAFMMVVCGFDYTHGPAYVAPDESVHERLLEYRDQPMERVMEIYDLAADPDKQLDENQTWRLPTLEST